MLQAEWISKRTRTAEASFLVLMGIVMYVGTCARPSLTDEADAANAEAGYQMVHTGDWITPQSNYMRRLNKPPMVYWLIAASYKVFGVSGFAARLPFALAAVGTILIIYLIGSLFTGGGARLYAGVAGMTSAGFFIFTRTIAGDILVLFFMSLGFYLFLLAYLESRTGSGDPAVGNGSAGTHRMRLMGFYACLALAIMSKGLIGLVLPFLTIGLFLFVSRDLAYVKEMRIPAGVLLFLAISAPWHAAAALRNPGFLYNYFINEHLLRFLGQHFPRDFTSIPVWEFWLVHLAGLFSWVFFLPAAKRFWPGNYRAMNRDEKVLVFLTLWAVSVLLFFSISARLEHYGLPLYPPCAAIAGFVLAQAARGKTRDLSAAAVCILITGITASAAGPSASGVSLGQNSKLTFFAPAAGLSVDSLRAMWMELSTFGLAMLFLGLTGFWSIIKAKPSSTVCVLAVGMVVIFTAIQAAQQRLEPYLSLKGLADRVNREWKPTDMLAVEGEFFNMSSIGFYTRKPAYRWRGHADWEFGSRFGGARKLFLNDDEFLRIWRSRRRVFLVAEKTTAHSTRFLRNGVIVGRSGTRVLLTNHLRRKQTTASQ